MRNLVEPIHIENPDWIPTLTGEVLLTGLLAKVIYTEPAEALFNALIAEDIFSEIPFGANQEESQQGMAILSQWAGEQQGALGKPALDALKVDYLALFIGPAKMHAPLWESVYFSKEHLVFQERTLEVRKWYRRFGLQVEHLNNEPDDHIGLEFSFIAHLASQALHAAEVRDLTGFIHHWNAQKEFFSAHLLQWGPEWSRLVIQNARTDFYRGIGHLTLGSLLAIAELLQVDVPEKAHA